MPTLQINQSNAPGKSPAFDYGLCCSYIDRRPPHCCWVQAKYFPGALNRAWWRTLHRYVSTVRISLSFDRRDCSKMPETNRVENEIKDKMDKSQRACDRFRWGVGQYCFLWQSKSSNRKRKGRNQLDNRKLINNIVPISKLHTLCPISPSPIVPTYSIVCPGTYYSWRCYKWVR